MLPRLTRIQDALAVQEVQGRVAQQALVLAWILLDPPDGNFRSTEELCQSSGYATITVERALNALSLVDGFQKAGAGSRVVDAASWVWPEDGSEACPERGDDIYLFRTITGAAQRRRNANGQRLWHDDGLEEGPDPADGNDHEGPIAIIPTQSPPALAENAVALIKRPRHDMSTLGEAYCRVLQAGTTAQESFSIISQLNDLTGISHATPTVYTDTLQDQLDEAFTEFADKFSEATGYTMPSIRSTCPICLHGVVKPVCLDCGHLVCHSCVMSPYLYRPDLQLKCPMCKRVGTWRKVYPA